MESFKFLAIFILPIIFLAGCTSLPLRTGYFVDIQAKPQLNLLFKIGDVVTNGRESVTVNSVRTAGYIGTDVNSPAYQPDLVNHFAIADITVANTGNDAYTVDPAFITVTDFQGHSYSFDRTGTFHLRLGFNAVYLQPGDRERGEVAFQIPIASAAKELTYYEPGHPKIVIELNN